MPTRYTLELEGLKGVVTADTFKEVSQREDAKKTVKKALEERYTSGKNRWFFTPLSRLSSSLGLGRYANISQDFERFFCVIGSGWGVISWHDGSDIKSSKKCFC